MSDDNKFEDLEMLSEMFEARASGEPGASDDIYDLETMGMSEIVYVREVTSEEVKAFDAEAFSNLPDGLKLFSVHTANGVPVALLDDRDTAFAAARQYEMRALSVH